MELFASKKKKMLTESPEFCIAPWTHIHVLTTGEIYPCCMSAHETSNSIGNLRHGDTIHTAWSSEKMNALRLAMLNGKRSKLCERCYQMEQLGQESWRTAENTIMAHHLPVVEKTKANGSLAELNLPYLDIRFSNVCNLKCRICCPKLSSSWYSDGIELGCVKSEESAIIYASDNRQDLMQQIDPLLANLERIHFAGGEPLIMDEHYQIIERLIGLKRFDVRLSYNTNFSTFRYRHYNIIEMWRKFQYIYLQASLDDMGKRGDYMRKGQRWHQIIENREYLLRECPHVDFIVLTTVSIMNVLYIPEFYREWLEKGYIKQAGMHLNILFEPRYYNIRGLTKEIKERVEDKYREFIDGYLNSLGNEASIVKCHFEAVLKYMNNENIEIRSEFRGITKALDLLRNESFQDVFPELADFFSPSLFADLWLTLKTNIYLGRINRQ